MKVYHHILCILTLVAFVGCGSSTSSDPEPDPDPDPPPAENESYTAEDATTAFEAFNEYFYNEGKKLYYSTTAQSELAVGWPQAAFWHIIMDAYERTENEDYYAMIGDIYQGGKYNYSQFRWPAVKEANGWIYDDMMWWIDAMARANQITGEQKYLDDAIAGFDFVWKEAYDPEDGGMIWSWKASGKVAAVNYPTVIGAMRLYHITGEEQYLDKAKEIYSWARENLFQEESGRVADHKVGDDPPGFEDYTYNQGTAAGAAYMLYEETGEQYYLDDAIAAVDYTRDEMSNEEGILPAEGDWNEQGVLQAIFVRNVDMLIEGADQDQYLTWLQKNANTAWQNRDKSRNLMFRDYDVSAPKGQIQSYEASSAVGFMQVIPPLSN